MNAPRLPLLLLTAGVAARLFYGWLFPPPPAIGKLPDADRYVPLAIAVADHNALLDEEGKPTAMREPFYPILLGTFFKVFGKHYFVLLMLNCLLGAGALWIMFVLGRDLFSERVGLTALAIGAFYPPFIFYSAQPLRESLMVFLSAFTVYALIKCARSGRRWAAASGAAAACAALTTTTTVPFGLAAPLVFWPALKERGRAWPRARLHWLAFIAIYALWPARNYHHFKTWVLGSTTATGNHFYMFQIVPQEVGGTPRHYEILDNDPVWKEGYALEPVKREQFFWKAGLKKAAEDPLRYARLVAWRLLWDQWRVAPRPRSYAHSYDALRLLGFLTDGWILPLGFIGFLLARLRRPEFGWIYLYIASVAGVYALVLTMIRYRLPMMPWFILFSSFAIHEALFHLKQRRA